MSEPRVTSTEEKQRDRDVMDRVAQDLREHNRKAGRPDPGYEEARKIVNEAVRRHNR